jgi:hypothetical protein
MAVVNTQAYYVTATITEVKSFIVQDSGLLSTKLVFLFVLSTFVSRFFKHPKDGILQIS